MRHIANFIISAALTFMLAAPAQGSVKLRIITFDIMNMEEGESYMPWTSRSTDICLKLHKINADIMGLQDVDSLQLSDLSQGLPEYKAVAEKGSPVFKHQHTNPILYNSSILKLVDSGTFYIAETPEEPGNSREFSCCKYAVGPHRGQLLPGGGHPDKNTVKQNDQQDPGYPYGQFREKL